MRRFSPGGCFRHPLWCILNSATGSRKKDTEVNHTASSSGHRAVHIQAKANYHQRLPKLANANHVRCLLGPSPAPRELHLLLHRPKRQRAPDRNEEERNERVKARCVLQIVLYTVRAHDAYVARNTRTFWLERVPVLCSPPVFEEHKKTNAVHNSYWYSSRAVGRLLYW